MRTKPIKIDWDGLEDAFNERRDDLVHYLDLVTGHVVLEGEGEGEDEGEAEDLNARSYPDEAAEVPADDGTRLYVRPPDTARKIGWLRDFLARGGVETAVADELEAATGEESAAERIREVLNRNPEVRDEWFRFRAERIQMMIDEWIAAHGVRFVDPPPW